MLNAEIESWVETKIRESQNIISTMRKEGKVDESFFVLASSWINTLGTVIRTSIANSSSLIESGDINSPFDLFRLSKKQTRDVGLFEQMKDIIKSSSLRASIQAFAVQQIEKGRQKCGLPPVKPNWFPPIDLVYDVSNFAELPGVIVFRSKGAKDRIFLTNKDEVAMRAIDECIMACGALYQYVSSIRQVPEPDEVLKDPHQTMLSGGDCDDLTIVFCSLARSVGYRGTYLVFQPGHVFPGVVLKTLREINPSDLPREIESEFMKLRNESKWEQIYELVDTQTGVDPTLPLPLITFDHEGETFTFSFLALQTHIFSSIYQKLNDQTKQSLDPIFDQISAQIPKMRSNEIKMIDP